MGLDILVKLKHISWKMQRWEVMKHSSVELSRWWLLPQLLSLLMNSIENLRVVGRLDINRLMFFSLVQIMKHR